MSVLAGYRGGQAEDVPRLAATRHRLEAYRRQVVTLVDDEVTIVGDHVIHLPLAHQALNDGDVDDTGRAALAAADLADPLGREIEKTGKPGEPLVEELAAMNQDEGVGSAGVDQGRGDYRLAECGGRRQHSSVVPEQGILGSIQLPCQLAFEGRCDRTTAITLVAAAHDDAQVFLSKSMARNQQASSANMEYTPMVKSRPSAPLPRR